MPVFRLTGLLGNLHTEIKIHWSDQSSNGWERILRVLDKQLYFSLRSFAQDGRTYSARVLSTLPLAACVLLFGCSGLQPHVTPGTALRIAGAVHGGQQPVSGSTIQLYAVGTTADGSAATPLITATVTTSDGSGNAGNSNANAGNNFNSLPAGSFTITGDYTCSPASAEVYLVSTGGNPGLTSGTNNQALAMMAALGPCNSLSSSTFISVNELTTVGSLAALANYTASFSAIGSGTADAAALQTAFTTVNQYTSTSTGTVPGPALASSSYASNFEIDTLADAVSACINSAGGVAGDSSSCGNLFADATPSGGSSPTNTIAAILNILNHPALNVCPIYNLAAGTPPFQPTLASCPSSWTLPISTLAVNVSGPSTTTIGQTAQYAAAVSAPSRGVTNQSVTWTVNGVAGGNTTSGTISATGLYTPPATAPGSPVAIAATSVLSSTAVGSANVTVAAVSVAVTGPASVAFGQTGQYSAVVTGSSNQSVNWLVNNVVGGSSAEGTITTGGLYTAPATTPSSPVTITAQSAAATSATATVGVTVAAAAVLYATGDSRTVTQPTYPAVCQVLSAQFSTSQRASPPASGSDDTSRLQAALTACKNTGQSVELTASGTNNAFYTAELNVTGEALVIDSGVTLEGNAAYASQSELLNITGTNSGIYGPGTIDGRGDILATTPQQYTARLVQTNSANNFIAYNITLTQAIYPNLYIQKSNGATVWGITILTPPTRANADGIDIDSITNVTVINSTIEAGDDGIAIKTNEAAASNITVTQTKVYGTHGLSIGSQTFDGVSNILFSNNYVYGTGLDGIASTDANAINIKTAQTCGGLVQQVTYQNTCITGAKHLMVVTGYYTVGCSGTAGTPQFQNIVVNGAYSTSSGFGAYEQFQGYNATVPINAYFANINLDVVAQDTGTGGADEYAGIALDNSNVVPTGTGVTTSTFSTAGSVPSCSF
jgi:polygalacturonase